MQNKLNEALLTSEKTTGAIIAAKAMQSIGQETEYLHQVALAKSHCKQTYRLLTGLEIEQPETDIHVMD